MAASGSDGCTTKRSSTCGTNGMTLFPDRMLESVVIQKEEGHKASPPRAEDTDNFVGVLFHVRGKHISEDWCKETKLFDESSKGKTYSDARAVPGGL
jgi:hypothetical protein